jgi:hypothetical protein
VSDDERDLEEQAQEHVLALLEEHAIIEWVSETQPIVEEPADGMDRERRPPADPPPRKDLAVFALGRSLKKKR